MYILSFIINVFKEEPSTEIEKLNINLNIGVNQVKIHEFVFIWIFDKMSLGISNFGKKSNLVFVLKYE